MPLGKSLFLPTRLSFCRLDPCYRKFLLLLCEKHCSHTYTIRQLCYKYPYLTLHYFSGILSSQYPKNLARFFFPKAFCPSEARIYNHVSALLLCFQENFKMYDMTLGIQQQLLRSLIFHTGLLFSLWTTGFQLCI